MNDLSPGASLAWKIAAAETGESRHAWIEPAHLLIGVLSLEKLAQLPESYARLEAEDRRVVDQESQRLRDVLTQAALDASVWRRRLRGRLGIGAQTSSGKAVSRSPACKEAFERAAGLAGAGATTSLHLLAALVEAGGGIIKASLEDAGVRPEALGGLALATERRAAPGLLVVAPPALAPSTPELDRYGRDLTRLAAQDRLHPLIGRRHEIRRVVQALARGVRNNPVLVGEPGVGRTAIMEGLAQRVVQGQDAVLAGKRIVELNLGTLIEGARRPDDFHDRLEAILAELQRHPEVIVLLDPLHLAVGGGRGGEGHQDASRLVKPALAHGDLRCLGVTTAAEYARYVESDPGLDRRFEKVVVEEPSRDAALAILRSLRPDWEARQGIRIAEEALLAALDLCLRFDPDRRLPAKAIAALDEAVALALSPSEAADVTDRNGVGGGLVTEREVARALANRLGLPQELLSERPAGLRRARVLEMEPFLRSRLFGQDDAVRRVTERLKLAHGGVLERRGPLAVFLFLGPRGVGKTELARLLAEFLLGSPAELVRFDMAEFAESRSTTKLVGVPPGSGSQQEAQLTRRLRARPQAVVLIEDVERAHPRVIEVFQQVFEVGQLTDATGFTADARHAVFVLTSSLGTESVSLPGGHQTLSASVEAARRHLPGGLLRLVDDILLFRALEEEDALRVLQPRLGMVTDALWRQQGVRLSIDPETQRFIARAGLIPGQGVRELGRAVERLVEVPVAELVLAGKLAWYPAWRLVCEGGSTRLQPEPGNRRA